MKKTILMLAALASLALAPAAFAQDPAPMDHSAMAPSAPSAPSAQPKGDQGPSSQAFAAANARMHQDMDITFSGNADIDFVKGMIAHHQGAIDMAKAELQYGKDADVRKLAEAIIKAQEGEIAWMKEWLKKQGQ